MPGVPHFSPPLREVGMCIDGRPRPSIQNLGCPTLPRFLGRVGILTLGGGSASALHQSHTDGRALTPEIPQRLKPKIIANLYRRPEGLLHHIPFSELGVQMKDRVARTPSSATFDFARAGRTTTTTSPLN
jgi:hypothetical protein